jgi:hypothetical protein
MVAAPAGASTPQGSTQTTTGQPIQSQQQTQQQQQPAPPNMIPGKAYQKGQLTLEADTQGRVWVLDSSMRRAYEYGNPSVTPESVGQSRQGGTVSLGGAPQGGSIFAHQGEPEYSYQIKPNMQNQSEFSIVEVFHGGVLQPSLPVTYYRGGKEIGYQAPIANVVMSGKPYFGLAGSFPAYEKGGEIGIGTLQKPGPTLGTISNISSMEQTSQQVVGAWLGRQVIAPAKPSSDTFSLVTSAMFKPPEIMTIPPGSIITSIQGNPTAPYFTQSMQRPAVGAGVFTGGIALPNYFSKNMDITRSDIYSPIGMLSGMKADTGIHATTFSAAKPYPFTAKGPMEDPMTSLNFALAGPGNAIKGMIGSVGMLGMLVTGQISPGEIGSGMLTSLRDTIGKTISFSWTPGEVANIATSSATQFAVGKYILGPFVGEALKPSMKTTVPGLAVGVVTGTEETPLGLQYNIDLVGTSRATTSIKFMGKDIILGTGEATSATKFSGIILNEPIGNVEVVGITAGGVYTGGKLLPTAGFGVLGVEQTIPTIETSIHIGLGENAISYTGGLPSFMEAYKAEETSVRIADFSKYMSRTTEENVGLGMRSVFASGGRIPSPSIDNLPEISVFSTKTTGGGILTPGIAYGKVGKAGEIWESRFALSKIEDGINLQGLPETRYVTYSKMISEGGSKAYGITGISITDMTKQLGAGGQSVISLDTGGQLSKQISINGVSLQETGAATSSMAAATSKISGLTGISAVGYNLLGIVPSEGKAMTVPITEAKIAFSQASTSQVAFPKATYNIPTLSATMEKAVPQTSAVSITMSKAFSPQALMSQQIEKTVSISMVMPSSIARTGDMTRTSSISRTQDMTRTTDVTRTLDLTKTMDTTRTMNMTRTTDLTRTIQETPSITITLTPPPPPPPPPPTTILPAFFGSSSDFGKVKPRKLFGKGMKKQTKYTPSIVAQEFDIKAVLSKKFMTRILSGVEIRPIPIRKNKKR